MRKIILIFLLVLPLILSAQTIEAELTLKGKLLGCYVGTSAGLIKGVTLYVSEKKYLKKVTSVFPETKAGPTNILLVTSADLDMDALMGDDIIVTGVLKKEPSEVFHTVFSIYSENIT